MPTIDRSTLEAALVGYEHQAAKIEAAMAAIRTELGLRSPRRVAATTTGGHERPKRVLSASARKRMADAQKRRWAAVHAKTAAPKPRRKLSAATRAKLAANLAKARAAKAAKAAT